MNIIIYGYQSWLRDFKYNSFNLWKIEYYTNELMNEYNSTATTPSRKKSLLHK